ncbi:MAG TPA: methyltransferase domain-containing protein [Chitinophagaceae bacterium]|nr:methyltransferase domain-containing protein [Chitinophagaceae bacterium]
MEKTVAFTGSIPANYERYLGPFLFEPYALDLVSRLQDKKYDDILEIACGTGRATAHLARSVKHDSLTATDLNQDMIDVAKDIIDGNSINWQQADALDLPFEDNSFDLVVIQFGVMFFRDREKGLKEAHRVLKDGGKLIFNTWNKPETVPAIYEGRKIIESYFGDDPPEFYSIPFSMYDENELRSLTIKTGFKNVKVELVKKEGISRSASDLTKGMVEGNPVYLSIIERIPASLHAIKEDVRRRLIEKFGEHVKSPLEAWVVEANK